MTPNSAQLRFLAFHASHHLVQQWRWHFCRTQMRAVNERLQSATLWRDDLEGLLREGLMEQGAGESMGVTEAGRAWLASAAVKQEESRDA